jgi:hypothetical protein
MKINVKLLGPILHDNNTIRKVFRVDVVGNEPNITLDTTLSKYRCKQLDGGVPHPTNPPAVAS